MILMNVDICIVTKSLNTNNKSIKELLREIYKNPTYQNCYIIDIFIYLILRIFINNNINKFQEY